jgi:hypothetical protein
VPDRRAREERRSRTAATHTGNGYAGICALPTDLLDVVAGAGSKAGGLGGTRGFKPQWGQQQWIATHAAAVMAAARGESHLQSQRASPAKAKQVATCAHYQLNHIRTPDFPPPSICLSRPSPQPTGPTGSGCRRRPYRTHSPPTSPPTSPRATSSHGVAAATANGGAWRCERAAQGGPRVGGRGARSKPQGGCCWWVWHGGGYRLRTEKVTWGRGCGGFGFDWV